jgi:TonB-dependent starch-binding outer membrane protein SusC
MQLSLWRCPSLWLAVALTLGSAGPLRGQIGGSIRGVITEEATQRTLGGVVVQVLGHGLQARTDANGVFLLRALPAGEYTLRVTAIGYTARSEPVTVITGETAEVNFALVRTPIQLDALVVTGTAGETERRQVGNAVTSLDVGEITEIAPIANVQELLQYRAPGLSVIKNSGLAGAGSNVQIRGAGSLNAGYGPVYYVDGIRFEAAPVSTGGVTNSTVQFSSPLDFIDPADIETVEVIKGPAAATLYGADAAGGVIQIITKKGRRGAEGVQWTASIGVSSSAWVAPNPTNYFQCNAARIATPATYPGCADPSAVTWESKNGTVTGIPESNILRYSDSMFVITDDPLNRHPRALRDGPGTDVRLSGRGGSQTFNYFLSVNRLNEDGIFHNNFQNRIGGRANFEFTPTPKINLGVGVSYTRMHYQMPLSDNASNGMLRNAFRGRSRATTDPWESGFFGFGPDETNEFDLQTFEERTTVGVSANFNPFPWFENRLVLGMDKYDRRDQEFYRIDPTLKWGATNGTGAISQRVPVTHTWTVDYAGSVHARLSGALTSKSSAGIQLNARQFHRITTSGDGLVANNLNLIGAAANTDGDEGVTEQTSVGVYVQEQIGWRDRLFATGALRVDDNSAFGSDFSLVTYPKFSLAYVISDEDFFSIPQVDQLKLRFAWGEAGNSPAPFTADRTFSTEVATAVDQPVNALTPSAFGNPDLKAETGSEFEIGFDASLFRGLLGVELTYYNQHTRDALMSIPNAGSSGFGGGTHLINVGEIANRGVELLLTASPMRKPKMTWELTFSAATNHNELVSFGGTRNEIQFGAFTNSQRHREGYPLGGFWAVDVIRDANGNPVLGTNGAVEVDLTCDWPDTQDPDGLGGSCHEKFIGPSTPTRELGLANNLILFGNLRLFASLDYKGGHYIVCAICSVRNRLNQNTWEVANPDADPVEVQVWQSLQTVTHIMPADFLKLREVAVTYNVPGSWGGPFRRNHWSITLAGRNLWMTTRYKGTGDPEVSFTSDPDSFDRTDYAAVPQPRRLSATINVTF